MRHADRLQTKQAAVLSMLLVWQCVGVCKQFIIWFSTQKAIAYLIAVIQLLDWPHPTQC